MTAPAPNDINSAAFLDVERSSTGRRWQSRLDDDRLAQALAQQFALPDIVGRVIAARGVGLEEAESYLSPRLRDSLPDPSDLLDMDAAVERLLRAITAGETVGVFGDYDVDGATSAALLTKFFAALGRAIHVYIPDRVKEGYGPNVGGLMALKEAGVSLVITVDCGTSAFEPLAQAASNGLDVIVIDHHVGEPQLPQAVAVVNPNRLDETSPHRQLAAVGVAFLMIVALNRALRAAGWYGQGHTEPDLMAWLDLVALGTICDVVPLTGVNRAMVTQGLRILARRHNIGLAALADVAGLDERPEAYHAGFILGPRINAGGRVGEAGLGVRLLTADDADEAVTLAARLDQFNQERRTIEADVLAAALAAAEPQARDDDPLIIVAAEGWHPGVIGIVAGRLRERFNRPACVVALADGIGKGSGRSIPEVALGPAVIAARQTGLLINGGGHAAAAGFTIEAQRLGELRDFLIDQINRQIGDRQLVPTLKLDGALAPGAVTPELVERLDKAGPFGAGNPRPRFAFPAVSVIRPEIVGDGHVRCFIADASGGQRLKAIAFRSAEDPLGRTLLQTAGAPLHLAGHLRTDNWGARQNVQLIIEDAAPTQ